MNSAAKIMTSIIDSVAGYYQQIVSTYNDELIQKHVPQWIITLKYSSDLLKSGGILSKQEVKECLRVLEAFAGVLSNNRYPSSIIRNNYKMLLTEANRKGSI